MTRPTIAALGGPHTFGGQAARLLVERHPQLGDLVYLGTSAELFADDGIWRASTVCVPAHSSRTGVHLSTHRRLATRTDLFVNAEAQHRYRCALLGRPGTPLSSIKRVLGHTGSVNQSRAWLSATIPEAEVTIVDSHSLGAARAVAAGAGTDAAVGSEELAREVGLDILARDIDGGSVGLYWALSPVATMSAKPERLVVVGRTVTDTALSELVASLLEAGFVAAGLFCEPVGDELFHADVVAYLRGAGKLDDVCRTVAAVDGWRLIGAYESGTNVGVQS
jgi:prephenate dehydratase